MATAKKLPSGSWRCLVYSHTTAEGKRIYKSFTCDDPSPKGKRICEAQAAQWARDKKRSAHNHRVTFREAVAQYLAMREQVCSPTTIDAYKAIYKSHLTPLDNMDCDDITSADIQRIINRLVKVVSPKTIRNIYGFTVSVIREAAPENHIRCILPRKQPQDKTIPTDEQIAQLLQEIRGTVLELPVLLAAFGPMRRGEICALRTENISGTTVHVCENMVRQIVDGHNTWIIKVPKSAAGDRYIDYPEQVARLWEGKTGRITNMNPDTLTNEFRRMLKRRGLPLIRFHDLRHYSASVMHAIGIPDAYIMDRAGWGSDRALLIYRHSMRDKSAEMSRKTNAHFEQMQHEMQHEK